jgi:putative DNA primase/helicase
MTFARVISAAAIADALNGRPSGSGYVCECPAHADLRPSLSVTSRDGRVLVHCHAGCTQSAVIGALRREGLWGDAIVLGSKPIANVANVADTRDTKDAPTPPSLGAAERDPMRSWRGAMPFTRGCLVDRYLKTRGISVSEAEASSLRFSPALWHWPSRTCWPAMLARVTSAAGEELTTHQTFLARDGSAKAPLGDKARLFVAGSGWAGGGIWFGVADPDREYVIAEGIESLLAALRLLGAASGCAALSEGGIRRLVLPPGVKKIRIFADHDSRGQGLAAAQAAKRRWTAEGREVAISISPVIGWDANDILLQRLGRP